VHAHRDLANRAALLVASALDRALPSLRAAAAESPASGVAIDGCDVLDQTPTLCIGDTGDNIYTKDAQLLIDLGGNDTYENSAGAAYFADPSGSFGPFVSVNVDLGGDDTYTPKHVLVTPPSEAGTGNRQLVADGAALGVGVGILFDAAGNDAYVAQAPPPDDQHLQSYTYVQGTAATTLPGFAALIDLGGDDVHRVTGVSGHDDLEIRAQGFGSGLAPAVAGLVDAGSGNDVYGIDSGTALDAASPPEQWPQHFAYGQGVGSIGTGVLVDGGGSDSFSLAAHGRWTETDGYPAVGGGPWQIPLAAALGQGVGEIGGVGLLLEGPGPTSYSAEATSEGIAYNSVSAQATGGIGIGVLDDLSGDDSYRAVATHSFDRGVTVDDTCTDFDPETETTTPCSFAHAFVHAYNTANFSQLLYAQGFGYLSGQGLLHDVTGNDSYRTTVSGDLTTSMHDTMTAPDGPTRFDVWGFGVQWNVGQGVGQGEHADGILLDEAGTDAYVSRSSTTTAASATSDHGPGTPRVTALLPYRDGVWAQGTGYGIAGAGALLDLGGAGDRFDVSSIDTVTTSPDTGGALRESLGWPLAHGAAAAGNATGVFVALGQGTSISLSPHRGVCPGSGPRGYGGWVDCPVFGDDPGHQPIDYRAVTPATGLAPASTALGTSIAFTDDTPGTGRWGFRLFGDPVAGDHGSTIDVGGILTGPDGAPLSGRRVHFDLQALLKAEDVFYKVWLTTWEADAITDAHGVARTTLPLEDMTTWGLQASAYDFRLLATYDGAPGLYPAYAARPFQFNA
jgi:hypothetical protein